MSFQSTKTYGHDLGLSAVFRQWRAKSHCAKLHGYALSFKFVFEADELDENGWVQDFGGLKSLKNELEHHYDHTLLVANDDPFREMIIGLHEANLASVRFFPRVGVEAFAEHAYWLARGAVRKGVRVVSCECREHGSNSAIYFGEDN